jgi:hypothetical protein
MSPPRRSRRRLAPFASALIVSGLILFLLIGGVLSISQGSGPFRSSVDQSFAQQASVVASQSNASGGAFRSLMSTMPSLRRAPLQQDLDALVADTARASDQAAALTSPEPAGSVGTSFRSALAARAEAAANLRLAVDGLLGLAPLPIVGAAGTPGVAAEASGAVPPGLSAGRATAAIAALGPLLERSDKAYAAARHMLATGPGRARLASSRWVRSTVIFGAGAVATLVDELSGSPTLAPDADVQLVAVRLSPPVVPIAPPTAGLPPPPPTTPGVSVVSPTHRLSVTPTIDNVGNVAESRLALTVTLQPLPTGKLTIVRHRVSLAPGTAVAVSLAALPVRPGGTYALTVTINPPAGQTDLSQVSVPATVEVAPALPPARSSGQTS